MKLTWICPCLQMETAVQHWIPKFSNCNMHSVSVNMAAADVTVELRSFQTEFKFKQCDDWNPSSGLVELFKSDEHGTLTLVWKTSAEVSTWTGWSDRALTEHFNPAFRSNWCMDLRQEAVTSLCPPDDEQQNVKILRTRQIYIISYTRM